MRRRSYIEDGTKTDPLVPNTLLRVFITPPLRQTAEIVYRKPLAVMCKSKPFSCQKEYRFCSTGIISILQKLIRSSTLVEFSKIAFP